MTIETAAAEQQTMSTTTIRISVRVYADRRFLADHQRPSLLPLVLFAAVACRPGLQGRVPPDQVLYLNSGRAFKASLVAPGRTTLLSAIFSDEKGTTTYFVPIPRKPPTDRTA
jgi:hypothetical protein